MDLRDAVSYHQMVLGAEGKSEDTQRNYLHYQRLLLSAYEDLGIPLELAAVTPASVRQALEWYREHVAKDARRGGQVAVRQFVERIKTFVSFLENEELLPEGTLRRLKAPRVTKVLREPFQQAEVAAMWGAARLSRTAARDEALFLLLLDTGMRIGEAATLTLDRLRLDQRHVLVGEHGKGKRERLVPIGDGARRDGGRVLRAMHVYLNGERAAHPRPATRVFLSFDGYPLEADGASEAVQRMGERAGVPNAIPHRLRHTFCTWYLVTFPGDELGLRRIVGHLSHSVLADYVHFAQTIVADRAGRASLSEAWLGPAARASTFALPARRATAEAPAANERPRTAADLQPRRTSGTFQRGRNGSDLSNVAGFQLHHGELILPFEG